MQKPVDDEYAGSTSFASTKTCSMGVFDAWAVMGRARYLIEDDARSRAPNPKVIFN
jgi:hypothetical protein